MVSGGGEKKGKQASLEVPATYFVVLHSNSDTKSDFFCWMDHFTDS